MRPCTPLDGKGDITHLLILLKIYRRRTQVVKGAVCKTVIQRFKSARRLQIFLQGILKPSKIKSEHGTGVVKPRFRKQHVRDRPRTFYGKRGSALRLRVAGSAPLPFQHAEQSIY